jgi:hypothetical protein
MNPFSGSFSTNPAAHNQQNPSSNAFPSQKDLLNLPLELQNKILSLQQKQPQGNQFKTPKVLHPPPDASELGAYQTSKKFKGNENPLTLPSDSLAGFPQFMNGMQNHKPLDFPMQRDQGFPPDLRYLGLDPQTQAGLLDKNPMLANFSLLESMNKQRQMPMMPQSNYFGGNLFAPDARGQKPADSLVIPDELNVNMNNSSREQSLKNLLLLQALQGQNDVLPNMYSPFQQQLQMLNNPQFQGLQSMGMPFGAGGGVNPLLALQYLEMQKRMEAEYAVMQAKNQMLQSLQNSDLQHQAGMQLPEGLTGRNSLESSLLGRAGGLRPEAFGNFKDPRLQQLPSEMADRQLHKSNESLLLRRGNLNQNPLAREEQSGAFQQQAALAKKLQENRNIIIPKAEPAHVEREAKKSNEVKMEPHIEPSREILRNQRKEPVQPLRENPKAPVPEIQRPRVNNDLAAASLKESKKNAKNRDANYTDYKELKEAQAIKASDERARRRQQREEASGLPKAPITPPPKPEIKKEPLIVGIIQPKSVFSKIFNQKYNIPIHGLGQYHLKTVSLGKNHQAQIGDLEINDFRYNQEPKRTLKLVSTPTITYGEIVSADGKKHIPLDFDAMTLKEPKQIHVGEEFQAKIADFDLNLEEEKRKRLCRLLSNPQTTLNHHQANGLESA